MAIDSEKECQCDKIMYFHMTLWATEAFTQNDSEVKCETHRSMIVSNGTKRQSNADAESQLIAEARCPS
jgi:hypothetical protein